MSIKTNLEPSLPSSSQALPFSRSVDLTQFREAVKLKTDSKYIYFETAAAFGVAELSEESR